MSIKIAVCDDTPQDIERLTDALYTYDNSFHITTYTSGETLLDAYLDCSESLDILFLDIYMPGLDGMETARKIRDEYKDIKIIFISSSQEHYPQAYDVFAFNYILKPLSIEKLYVVLGRAVQEINREHSQKICISYKSTVHSIDCQDILYIESRDKLILFHLSYKKTSQCYGKLDEIMKQLPAQSFIRCHQSFIVNIAAVTEMGGNYFRIGQVMIGISKKHTKTVKDEYYSYLFSHMQRGQTL